MTVETEYKSFSEELRVKSRAIHDKSDKLVNLKLAVALTNTKLYGSVLHDFYCIFKAIEDQVERHKNNEYINRIWLPEMARKEAFEKDLEFYLGVGWQDCGSPSQAAQDYSAHIYSAIDEEPELLLAYIHTMYLAILSGGYILKKIIVNSLGLSGTEGVASLEFPDDVSRLKLKNHIKSTLDCMDLDRKLKDRIVHEKIMIFKRNNKIVASIQPTLRSGARIFKMISILVGSCALCYYAYSWYSS